jgi:hypothetical protein
MNQCVIVTRGGGKKGRDSDKTITEKKEISQGRKKTRIYK